MVDETAYHRFPHHKPYPAYKDSGVEWLGEIPAHWEVKRLKYAVTLNPPPTEARNRGESLEVSFVPMEAIGEYGGLELTTTKLVGEVYTGYTYFREGDVVVAKITPCFENGKGAVATGLVNEIAFGTTELHVLRVKESINRQFLFYLSMGDEFRRLGEAEMYGAGGQKRVPDSFIRNLMHPLPPLSEQRAIAAFLDRETAKIDALVAKKERLIELLQEKRTALISDAVTKGLDPDVPLKDSGVEWLGEIPAHWIGLPLKRWVAVKITDGPHETPQFVLNGIDFISAEAVSNRKINFDKRRGFISPELHAYYSRKCKPIRDDILICKSGATTGKLARVDTDHEFSIWSPLAMVRSNRSRIIPRFLEMALEAEYVQNQIKRTWSAGTQPNISMGDLERLHVVAPDIKEQRKILAYVDSKTDGFSPIIDKVREALDRLKELRTALISAAVTGKIDVREAAA